MKLSIITINYNNSHGLIKTIQSIISQSHQDFEFIVIDGNSSDGSSEVLEEYRKDIDQLVVEKDDGIYHAMNKGIKLAKGKYLLFLNSGDELYSSDTLEKALEYFNGIDIFYGDLIWRDGLVTCYPDFLNFSFLRRRSLPHQASFIKRELFHKYGFYEEGDRITSDWKFFLLCICKFNVSYKKIPLVISKMEPGGISDSKVRNTGSIIYQEKLAVLNSEFQAFRYEYQFAHKINHLFLPFTLKFWKRYFSKYKKSTAVSKYDW